jgi:TonB family protein
LDGRSVLSLPKPEYTNQVEGDVVVEVTVDKDGRVIQATPGYRGSTTLDENLLQLAKKAALIARFDRNPNAPAVQKGTITYKFRLQ